MEWTNCKSAPALHGAKLLLSEPNMLEQATKYRSFWQRLDADVAKRTALGPSFFWDDGSCCLCS
jgi:hypothetical protein